MATLLLVSFILLFQIYSYTCEIAEVQNTSFNDIKDNGRRPFTEGKQFKDSFDEYLGDPVASINIDYLNNALILQFRRSIPVDENDIEEKRRMSVDKNFMRFGKRDQHRMRFGKRDEHRMRFGKRQRESEKDQRTLNTNEQEFRSGRSEGEATRSSRGDSFMRLGRQGRNENLMRFGRGGNDNQENRSFMRFGRVPVDQGSRNFMRFGRDPLDLGNELNSNLYLGESVEANSEEPLIRQRRHNSFMRLGRSMPKPEEPPLLLLGHYGFEHLPNSISEN